jgi:hypothetical protein
MARLAAIEYDADWVINTDADEFWWPAAGTLADTFAAIPERYGQIIAPRNNFVPPRVYEERPFYEQLVVRERASQNLNGEPLEPKVAHRGDAEIVVAPGNHSVSSTSLAPMPANGLIEVLHFPMRTFAQFERKVLATGIGYESLPFRSEEVGRDQLKLLELQREGKLLDYFERYVLSDETVASGLESGELIVDRRLATFMAEQELTPAGTPNAAATRPNSDAARRLVEAALADGQSVEHDDDQDVGLDDH